MIVSRLVDSSEVGSEWLFCIICSISLFGMVRVVISDRLMLWLIMMIVMLRLRMFSIVMFCSNVSMLLVERKLFRKIEKIRKRVVKIVNMIFC